MLRKPAHRIARKSFLYNTQGNTNRGRWENTWRKELGKDEYYMKICRKPQEIAKDRRVFMYVISVQEMWYNQVP